MTLFAITFWVYQKTGKATPVAMMGFYTMIPFVLLGLFTGALVDRWDRRITILMGDVGSLLVNSFLCMAMFGGFLAIWHIYATTFILSCFQTFHWPAMSSSVSVMVDKKHYGRATSLLEMAGMSSNIMARLLGGALLGFMGLGTVLLLTLCGNLLAILSLSFIDFGPRTPMASAAKQNLLQDIRDGFACLWARRPLIALQVVFMVCNFLYFLGYDLLGPYVLAKTGNNRMMFASVETAAAVGGLAGCALVTLTGGPRNKVLGALWGWVGIGLLGIGVVGLGRTLPVWMAGAFLCSMMGNLNYSSNQALWQAKVPPSFQGRVFALRKMLAFMINPLASLAAGPLIDRWLEPGMRPGGALSSMFGSVFGVGAGSGMGFLFGVTGVGIALVAIGAWMVPFIRQAQTTLPDHEEVAQILSDTEEETLVAQVL